MAISFDTVPNNIRLGAFLSVEFNAERASQGPALLAYRGLIIGQRLSSGTATANTLHRVTSVNDVITLAGRGSLLHRQAIGWFASNTFTEVWIGVLDDDAAGVAATGTITYTGPATADGTIALYIGGVRMTAAVTSGDADSDIATAVSDAINAAADLPVTASATLGVVTVTFRHKGLTGNDLDIRHNHRSGDAFPTGVGATIVGMASGTTNPALDTLIAAMGDTWFHVITHPYTDATSLTSIENEMESRNGPLRMIDGIAITSAVGSHSTLVTLGDGRNSRFSSIVAQDGDNPLTPPWEFAAEMAALVAFYGNADPARPLQTLALTNALAQDLADRFTPQERNLLLFDGIATTRTGAGDVVQIERVITTYQTNPAGAADTAYLDVTTILTLLYLRYSFRVRIQTRYPRHKLAQSSARAGGGQSIMTPRLGKSEAVGWFKEMEALGLVENLDQFKTDLVVEINSSDPNRMDWLLPPDLVNQFRVGGVQIQYLL